MKSKDDLVKYCKTRLNYWLPEAKKMRLDFLQDIISGKKRALKAHEVKVHNVPMNLNEFAVKVIWPKIKDDENLRRYLPT